MIDNEILKARELLARGAAALDVRTPQEFSEGHLKDAIHIPVQELEARLGELTHLKTKDIVVYCKSGQRSEYAKALLLHHGFQTVLNGGGLVDLI